MRLVFTGIAWPSDRSCTNGCAAGFGPPVRNIHCRQWSGTVSEKGFG